MTPIEPSTQTNKINRLRRLSQVLDNAIAIPGTGYRIGIDPILGLLPGGGDTIAGALGAYIIFEAARMGIPRKVVGIMVGNILLDSLLGIVPVVGDLFDIGWKANLRNMALLEEHLQVTPTDPQRDRLFLIGLILLLTIIVLGLASLAVVLIGWLWQIIN